MKKIEQLRAITQEARQANEGEIQNLYEAIYELCHESAELGAECIILFTRDLKVIASERLLCRSSSFVSSACEAILRMRTDGFFIKESSEGWKIVWTP